MNESVDAHQAQQLIPTGGDEQSTQFLFSDFFLFTFLISGDGDGEQ